MATETFRIRIVVDPNRATKGAKRVEKSLQRIENRANRLRKTLGITFGALAGTAAIFGAIRNLAKFEESMAVVRAVTRATVSDFKDLSARAQELGITTRFSATQAADAMVLLARAGFSVNETMEAVQQTLFLAQAGSLGMAEAADITASALRGFGLATSETARVTDTLVAASNRSNTNVSQLGQALKFVAPIAKGLGQSIEITTAALGALSDAGLKGTLAGTGLRRVLAELASPGRELADILTAAGLAAEDVDPTVVSLTTALERLKVAGFDTGDALEVFGQRGGPAFAVLVDNIPKIREMTTALENAGGEAKAVADIMDDTLSGAIFRFKSALEGVNLAIGKVFTSPIVRTALEGMTIALRAVARSADVLQFAFITLATLGVIKLAFVIKATLLPVLGKATKALLVTNAAAIKTAFSLGGVRAAILAVPFIPFLLAGVAIAAVATGAQKVQEDVEGARKVIQDMEADAGFAQIGDQIQNARKELKGLLKGVKAVAPTLDTLFQQPEDIEVEQVSGKKSARLLRIEALTEGINNLKAASKDARLEEIENQERAARGADGTDAAIAQLERRRDVLSALTVENKKLVAFQQILDRLEKGGSTPNKDEKERLRFLSDGNVLLEARQRIFNSIKGPQAAFNADLLGLQSLLDDTTISQEEFNIKLAEMEDTLARASEKPLTVLENLDQKLKDLELTLQAGIETLEVQQLINQALREESTFQNAPAILAKAAATDEVTAAIQAQTDAREEQARVVERARIAAEKAEDREKRILDRLALRINGQAALNIEIGRMQTLFETGRISLEQLNTELLKLQIRGLEASNSLEAGFERAFLKIQLEAENLAAVGEKVVNIFADRLTEALQKAAEEGKLSFKDLARSILQDLQRILIRALIVKAITAALGVDAGGGGGGGGGLGSLIAAGIGGATGNADTGFTRRANGGPVQPNRSFLVGEDGPEIFQPRQSGTIIPNGATQQAAAPIIQVVNVQSEEDIPNAINDGGADDAIINVLARNKDKVNQIIA